MICGTAIVLGETFTTIVVSTFATMAITYVILESIERYYHRNRDTMYELDSQYYAVLSIVPTFFVIAYEVFGFLARGVPAPRYIIE